MKPACFEFWLATRIWSFYELAFLLKGFEPVPMKEVDSAHTSEMRETLVKMEKRAVLFWRSHNLVPPLEFGLVQCPLEWSYDSRALLKWAESLPGIKVPTKLLSLMKPDQHKIRTKDSINTSKREKNNLLLIIGALADLQKLDITQPTKSADKISVNMETRGIEGPSVQTIAKRLAEVAEIQEDRKT